MSELKPCPFCGSPARVVLDYQDIERWAQCTKRKPESCVLSTAIIEIVKWNRRTQPEATKPAQDLSAAILAMNRAKLLPIWDNDVPHTLHVELDVIFKTLAALASPADALVAGDRVYAEQINFSVYDDPRFKKLTDALYMTGFHQAGSGDREVKALADYVDARNCQSIKDAERWRFRQKFLLDGGAVLWSQRGCQYRNAQGAIICQGGTEEEAIDAAIQAQKDGHG